MQNLLALLPLLLFIGVTFKGVNRTLKDTPNIANRMAQGLYDGRVKIMYDSYEADGSEVSTDIIEMGPKLPIGATIIDVILDTDALGGNATLTVGDYESAARYISATDHGAAALVTRMDSIGGRMYEIDETTPGATSSDRQIIITVGVSAITGTIKLVTLYTHD